MERGGGSEETTSTVPGRAGTGRPTGAVGWELGWLLLAVGYLMFGFLYSVIQPPTAIPDEAANMQYVRFLAENRRLPRWEASGHGEGGYETQHPPLAYSVHAIADTLSSSLPENMRWHVVRWSMVALGLILFFLMRSLAVRVFPTSPLHQLALVATVQILPLTLLYLCHANPDGIGLIIGAAALLITFRIYGDAEEPASLPWIGGAIAAAAALTKLSAGPLGLILLAAQWFRPAQEPRERRRRCGILLAVWVLGASWWYLRNLWLHGRVFLHTPGARGTALEYAPGWGWGHSVWGALSEAYLTTWVQRGWFPEGLDYLFYSLIVMVTLLALTGFVWHRRSRGTARMQGGTEDSPAPGRLSPVSRFELIACLSLLVMVFLGQQFALWFVDVEFNAGGRYLLVTVPALAVLLTVGVSSLGERPSRWILTVWVGSLLAMNIASAYNLAWVLVPRHFPGWAMFHFPTSQAPATENPPTGQ